MVLEGLEHFRVVMGVELNGKHIGDAGIPQALMPQGVAAVQRKHADERLGRTTVTVRGEMLGVSEGALSCIANSIEFLSRHGDIIT